MTATAERVRQEFEIRFGAAPRLFRAPGRVNLIGEHTDYNGGFVLPAAIDLATYVGMGPRADGKLHAESLDLPGSLDTEPGALEPAREWTDYLAGVAVMMGRQEGANLLVASDVPIGGGLSSSAALEVATALALGADPGRPVEIALLSQRAENEFAGMRCGIMDQFAVTLGRAGHALLIDCRDLSYQPVPLPSGLRLVIANTMVKHELAAGAYNTRRAECEEAARRLGVTLLREVDEAEFARRHHELPVPVRNRCAHVISENARVLRFVDALRRSDLETAGRLMAESHQSLRDDFAVSCEELDTMVEIGASLDGVVGARMTGGGFGGCAILLVAEAAVPGVVRALGKRYERATGILPEIYVCQAADGAREIT